VAHSGSFVMHQSLKTDHLLCCTFDRKLAGASTVALGLGLAGGTCASINPKSTCTHLGFDGAALALVYPLVTTASHGAFSRPPSAAAAAEAEAESASCSTAACWTRLRPAPTSD